MYEPLFCSQYQLALYQIASLRKDGHFVGADGNIPEGQGIVLAHLNECHELLGMVRVVDPCLNCHGSCYFSSRKLWTKQRKKMRRNWTKRETHARKMGILMVRPVASLPILVKSL